MKSLAQLFSFKGGVKPASHKVESADCPIRPAPMPARLIVPLRQSAGHTAQCLVEVGQKVQKGQMIGAAEGVFSSATHAPTSGTVVAVGPEAVPHPSGLAAPCVVIETDGEDRWGERTPLDWRGGDPEVLRGFIRDAGIVGLGGATFPSHIKLKPGAAGEFGGRIPTLVINGAECEPWITCDDRLMRERAEGILRGAAIMRHLVGAEKIIVGIEDNKPQAVAAMRAAAAALGEAQLDVVAVPTRYPAGGEKQLIRVLTGIEIPYGKLGTQFGVQCFNVGTAYAIHRAVEHGEPLISRLLTLTGNVARPGNYEVLIGTPIETLLPLAEPRADTNGYLMGGPMMGFTLPRLDVPVVKSSNCVIAASPALFPQAPPEMPCIRCGACARACPAELQPFELYWHSRAKNFGKAQEYHIFDCIECGCCSYVCPSRIRLVDYFRFAKSSIRAREREKSAADLARERYEFRLARDEREKQEKAAKLAAKAAETKAKLAAQAAATTAAADDASGEAQKLGAGGTASEPADDPKKALIAAAMARAQAQKAASHPENTEALNPEVQAEIQDIEARRAKLRETAKAAQPQDNN
ncbi:MAG: electron transport complex subunit RsxC [Gammaproteobacteria bacterium]|nr:electron transport complex subunit RsxC [Gammaproteobacteria bacterium]MBU1645802.1 electron transport complex subunit RsxC [Gammaproteobacteria bacterium]MBU1971310.1 electron transport complex subunit RsxC [Gammaproteobacteria bacterium]